MKVDDTKSRPCICGNLWGLFRDVLQAAECLCHKPLSIIPAGKDEWYVQHGENPEHRSPNYTGESLLAVCDWIDSVCLNDRVDAEEAQG